jgi:hypothetical protein
LPGTFVCEVSDPSRKLLEKAVARLSPEKKFLRMAVEEEAQT